MCMMCRFVTQVNALQYRSTHPQGIKAQHPLAIPPDVLPPPTPHRPQCNRVSVVLSERLLLSIMILHLKVRDPRITMISLLVSHFDLCHNLFPGYLTSHLGYG